MLYLKWYKHLLNTINQSSLQQFLKLESSCGDHNNQWWLHSEEEWPPYHISKPCSPEATTQLALMFAWLSSHSAAFKGLISQADDFYYSPPTRGRDTPPDPTGLSNISSVTSESLVTILLSTEPAAFGPGVQSHWTVTTLPIKLQCCLMKGLTSLLSWHPCQRASDPTSAFCSHAAVIAETRWRPPSALGYAHWWLYNLISHKSH